MHAHARACVYVVYVYCVKGVEYRFFKHDGIETPLIRDSKIDPQIRFLFIQKKKKNEILFKLLYKIDYLPRLNFSIRFSSIFFLLFYISLFLFLFIYLFF